MKIVILTASLHHGGASINALDIAGGMAKIGHDILFISSGESSENYSQNGYRIEILPQKKRNPLFHYINPVLLNALNNVLNNFKPDLIHVHNINLQSFSLAALLLSRRYPMVWTLHDIWPLCMTGWPRIIDCKEMLNQCQDCPAWPGIIARLNRLLKDFVYRHSRFIIVSPSDWLASLFKRTVLFSSPLHVIRYGIDRDFFTPMNSKVNLIKKICPEGKKILLFSGGKQLVGESPAWRKGFKYLLSALSRLKNKRNDFHLLYVGDTINLSFEFNQYITFAEGVSREEMKYYYSAADIFVLPTLADNSPLTILEAMACKVPIIATNVGGIAECITHDEPGLLCPPRNATALAESIEYLLLNPMRGIEMTERAYQRFINEFTFERMVDQYEDVYHQAISSFHEKQ